MNYETSFDERMTHDIKNSLKERSELTKTYYKNS